MSFAATSFNNVRLTRMLWMMRNFHDEDHDEDDHHASHAEIIPGVPAPNNEDADHHDDEDHHEEVKEGAEEQPAVL